MSKLIRPTPRRVARAPLRLSDLRWNRAVAQFGVQGGLLAVLLASVAGLAVWIDSRKTPDPTLQALAGGATRAGSAQVETFVAERLKIRQPAVVVAAPKSVEIAAAPMAVPEQPMQVAVPPPAAEPPAQVIAPQLPVVPVVAAEPPATPPPAPVVTPTTSETASTDLPVVEPVPSKPFRIAALTPPAAPSSPIQAEPVSLPDIVTEAFRHDAERLEADRRAAEALAAETAARRAVVERRAVEDVAARTRVTERAAAEALAAAAAVEAARKAAQQAAERRAGTDKAQLRVKARAEQKPRVVEKSDADTKGRRAAERSERAKADAAAEAKAEDRAAKRAENQRAEEQRNTRQASVRERSVATAQAERFAAAQAERSRAVARPRYADGGGRTTCTSAPLPRSWVGGLLFRGGLRYCN